MKQALRILIKIILLTVLLFPKAEADNILDMSDAEALYTLVIIFLFLPTAILCLFIGLYRRLSLHKSSQMIYFSGFAIMLGIYKIIPVNCEPIKLQLMIATIIGIMCVILVTLYHDKKARARFVKWQNNGRPD